MKKPKSRKGRPKKFETLERISLSLSEEDKQILQNKSKGFESVSHYIRTLIRAK